MSKIEEKSKWTYDRTNSKGEKKFKKFTNEALEDAVNFLEEHEVAYTIREGATMVWIHIGHKNYQYYYTTGRWGVSKYRLTIPDKHYQSNGIQDLFDKHLFVELERERRVNLVTSPDECFSEEVCEILDENCGEIVLTGRKLIHKMPNEMMAQLKKDGKLYYEEGYYYIDSCITRESAIEKYGEITEEEYGIRGGWKSITFGTTKFVSKFLKNERRKN